jgi:S-adenosylmethionine hydrolase
MGIPIVTLTSDFGVRDHYVAAMKAAVLQWCPAARLIDVTHEIAPQDVLGASITLGLAMRGFAAGTVHLAVVDPGVGTRRRMLVCRIADQWVVAPDNGLVTWAWRNANKKIAYELTWRPDRAPSRTFHGRDIFGPAAGRLAGGTDVHELGRRMGTPVLLDVLRPARAGARRAVVIQIDRFGNATTQFPADQLPAGARFVANGHRIGPLRRTYSDVKPLRPLALIGSSGLLEIAVRDGSAGAELGLVVGSVVRIVAR